MVRPVLEQWAPRFPLQAMGTSVLGEPIYQLLLGRGAKRVLMWSQMHGNESTTTKAVLDLLGFLGAGGDVAAGILEHCTLCILPMLNPDGARAYTRVNANGVDLNRDAQLLSQPESRALHDVYKRFRPHFCFNLHDQRTIFNVGKSPKPATLSFLAPACDEARTVSRSRADSMKLIAAINKSLQELIPGQVGRYDDSFNLNCVGDTFQALQTPTLLFEAGHYPGDYPREQTRMLVFQALATALDTLGGEKFAAYRVEQYLAIPENGKNFLDIIVTNAHQIHPQWEKEIRVGIQFTEELRGNNIYFMPKLQEVGLLRHKFAHQAYDGSIAAERKQVQEQRELYHLLN